MLEISSIGYIGQSATIVESATPFVKFTLAISKSFVDSDAVEHHQTDWLNVTTNQVKLAQYLKSGIQIFCRGLLSTNIYINKDNNPCISLNVRANMIQLLSSKKEPQSTSYDKLPESVKSLMPTIDELKEVINTSYDQLTKKPSKSK